MHFHQRYPGIADHVCGISQTIAVMRECRRVHDHRNRTIRGLMHPMNHLGFVVSLPNLDIQTEVTAPPLTILTKRLQILMTVDIRLADTKTAKIRPIDDKNTTRHTFTFLRSDDIGLVDTHRVTVRGESVQKPHGLLQSADYPNESDGRYRQE